MRASDTFTIGADHTFTISAGGTFTISAGRTFTISASSKFTINATAIELSGSILVKNQLTIDDKAALQVKQLRISNYGPDDPGSSTTGYGFNGALYFKIVQ
jgi:hypothetical protein